MRLPESLHEQSHRIINKHVARKREKRHVYTQHFLRTQTNPKPKVEEKAEARTTVIHKCRKEHIKPSSDWLTLKNQSRNQDTCKQNSAHVHVSSHAASAHSTWLKSLTDPMYSPIFLFDSWFMCWCRYFATAAESLTGSAPASCRNLILCINANVSVYV